MAGLSDFLPFTHSAISRFIWFRWYERKIYGWLQEHTADRPGRTHKSTKEASVGTYLPEDLVRSVCMKSRRILTADNEHWSIWRLDRTP